MHQAEREDFVPDAVAAGRVGALPKRVGQSWEKVGKAYEQIAMVLKDEEQVLLWEFHQGGDSRFTKGAILSGGRVGRPVDLREQPVGDEKLTEAVMWMLEKHQPWLVVITLGPDSENKIPRMSRARGFRTAADEDEDAMLDFVTAIVEKQHAGGRLVVITGEH